MPHKKSRKAKRKPKKTPLGILGSLPQEVREMIYGYVLAAGHPALTRTSKAMNATSKGALYQHGVYRVTINLELVRVWEGPQWAAYKHVASAPGAVPYKYLTNVRNLGIRISLSKNSPAMNLLDFISGYGPHNMMRRLAQTVKDGRNCLIQFEESVYRQFSRGRFKGLRLLKKFEDVTVELWDNDSSWFSYIKDPKRYDKGRAAEMTALMTEDTARHKAMLEIPKERPNLTFIHHPPKNVK